MSSDQHRHQAGSDSPLTRIADEIDLPLLVVLENATIEHANRPARRLVIERSAFELTHGRFLPVRPDARAAWLRLLQDASVDRFRWAVLQSGDGSMLASARRAGDGPDSTNRIVVWLERPRLASPPAIDALARSLRLSAAEGRVFERLLDGLSPNQIAGDIDTSIDTVRTHLRRIREKAGVRSVQELLLRAARLPPVLD